MFETIKQWRTCSRRPAGRRSPIKDQRSSSSTPEQCLAVLRIVTRQQKGLEIGNQLRSQIWMVHRESISFYFFETEKKEYRETQVTVILFSGSSLSLFVYVNGDLGLQKYCTNHSFTAVTFSSMTLHRMRYVIHLVF